MRRRGLLLAGILVAAVWPGGGAPAGAAEPATVARVELVSPQQLPEDLVRAAIGDLTGRPLSRAAIRQSLDRVWSLGLFAELWVDEVSDADGLRLRFHCVRRPILRRIAWEGALGLPDVELVGAAGLAVGGDAGQARLAQARRSVLAAYAREGYFAAQVEIRTEDDPATNERDVTLVLQAGSQARIGAVELRGVTPEVAAALRDRLDLDAGDEFRQPTARERVQKLEDALRKEGYFEARLRLAEPVWDSASNRVTVEVDAERGPKYQVEFQGVTALKESDLRARLTFQDAGVVDEAEVAASTREVEAAYREAGFHFVRASGSLRGTGEDRTVRFEVDEGPRVTVEKIAVSGNVAFPASQLLARLDTRLPGILRPGLFRQDVLDRDLLVLTAFYRGRGFPDIAVGPADVQFSEGRRSARIVIPVREGPRLAVGGVTVEGATVRTPAEILAALPFKTGDPWLATYGTDAQRAVGRLYAQRGYLNTEVAVDATRSGERVDVSLQIREGAPTRVGRILVSGAIATREEVVRREIPFGPGDPFSPELLVEAERRLAGLGIFERVQVGPLRPPPVPFADVEVSVREGRPWRVEFGGGYGTDRGWRGVLEVGHDNLFGTAQSASVREKVAQNGDRTDLTYRVPRLLGTPFQGDVGLFRERWQEIGYKRQGAGVAAGIQRDLFRDILTDRSRLRASLRYQLEWVRRYAVDQTLLATDAAAIVAGSQLVGRITPGLTLDYRDNVLDPSRGSFHTISFDLAGPYLGGEVSFIKSRLETAWYLDWLSPLVLAVGGRLGMATPLSDTAALPIEDRFYAGGSASIRGYPQDLVGPRDPSGHPTGGNALLVLNAEGRFPIWRWISGVVFVDTGSVVPEVDDLGGAVFKTGVGGGIRVKTPVGPLRLDVGYALNPIEDKDRWQLYFGIGQAF